MRRLFPIGVLLLALFSSCDVFNKDEKEPAFLVIPALDLETDESVEGTDSHSITEVWVYANDHITGVYDLPAEIPILEEGATDIRIFGGIKNNGISSTRIIYPFYASVDATLDLSPLQYDTISPVFHYHEDLDIVPYDFETGIPFEAYGNSDVGLISLTDKDKVFEGEASAIATLNTDQNLFLVKSFEQWEWGAGQTVFLEMNYSGNNSFAVGLLVHKGTTVSKQFTLIINPTTSGTGITNWKKIYVDLGYTILSNSDADFYEIYLEAAPDQGNSTVELYFDNLKIVEFEE